MGKEMRAKTRWKVKLGDLNGTDRQGGVKGE